MLLNFLIPFFTIFYSGYIWMYQSTFSLLHKWHPSRTILEIITPVKESITKVSIGNAFFILFLAACYYFSGVIFTICMFVLRFAYQYLIMEYINNWPSVFKKIKGESKGVPHNYLLSFTYVYAFGVSVFMIVIHCISLAAVTWTRVEGKWGFKGVFLYLIVKSGLV